MTATPDGARYSVVVPVHNGVRYVGRAIESAISQQPPGEILVVDDGSSDGSADAAVKVGGGAVRILTNTKALGPSSARNRAIAEASAPLIAFLDADDQWGHGKLAKQLKFLDAHPEVVAVFSDFVTIDTAGRPMGWQGGILAQLRSLAADPQRDGDGYVLKGTVAEALVKHTSFMHPSSVVARKTALEKAGGFDPSYTAAEDLDLWIRLALVGPVGYIDECLVTIESRPDSLGHKSLNMCQHLVRLYSVLPARLPNASPDLLRHIRQFLRTQTLRLGWLQTHEAGDLVAAQRSYRQSLRLGWSARAAWALVRVSIARCLPQRLWRGR